MGFFRQSKNGASVSPQPSSPPGTAPGVSAPAPFALQHGAWPPPMPHHMLPFPPVLAHGPGGPHPLPPPTPGKGSRRLARMRLAFSAALLAGVAGTLGIAAMMVYYTIVLPDPLTLRHKERAPVIRILANDGSVLAERGTAHDFMPIDMLPKLVTDAVVATEDRRFYEHWGIDPAGMTRAFFANLRAGRFAQGGSTLTQQLAKNLFLTHDRTIGRKVEELLLALWLEMKLTKSEILELYLNRVYFGAGAYGIESAAQRYFEKSARALTLPEAAVIAGLLKAPSKYAPTASPGAARARGRSVLRKMLDARYISEADERRAHAERVRFAEAKATKEPDGVEYAVDYALEKMPALLGAGHAEVVVETTIDAALQKRTHAIVTKKLAEQGERLETSQAAVVVLDVDGGIRALVGGRSYADSQYNRAVKARRQPGSAFKPFVYLAGLESGLTPETVVYDLPLSIEGWTPRNTTGRYQGAMPLRRALAESVNTVAARLQFDIGARRIADAARRLGIKSDLREDPSLALGTSEVTLLELTGSYGVFANGGSAIVPHIIRRVRMSSGRVLFAQGASRTEQVVLPVHVGAMNDMLNSALTGGTGRRAALVRHPAAGKTGTTTDFRDAVFVGYTAHYVAGVWSGNDNGKPMNKVMGGGLPAEIWREVMVHAHAGKAPLALPGLIRSPSSEAVAELATEPQPTPALRPAEALPSQRPRPNPSPVVQRPDAAVIPAITSPISSQPVAQRPLALPRQTSAPTQRADGKLLQQKVSRPDTTAHPTSRIDEDFIARALDGAKDADQLPAVAGLPSGFDVEAIRQRLKAAPDSSAKSPQGIMTLGAPPRP